MKKWIFLLSLICLPSVFAAGPERHSMDFSQARLIPIQNGGRVKPLDSFARETVIFETGSRKFQDWEPLDLLFSWMNEPEAWEKTAFIEIRNIHARRELGLDESRLLFSPEELVKNPILMQYMTTPNPDENVRQVFEKISAFREITSGRAWLLVPKKAPEPWGNLTDASPVRPVFGDLLRAYAAKDSAQFERESGLLRAAVEGGIPSWQNSALSRSVWAEALYNQMRPFQWAWIFYLAGAIFWALGIKKLAWVGTLGGFFFHVFGFGLRCYVAGRPPVTNMYESIVWVSLGVVVFSFILYVLKRQNVVLGVSSAVATLGLIVADSAPSMFDPGIHPLVPVLRSNYWLTIHVLTITLGYAAFALTLGLSDVTLFHFWRQSRDHTSPSSGSLGSRAERTRKIDTLNHLTYRAMQFGVVLLAAGTILGGVWADASWGRFWGWDPKETWALIAFLTYIAILHGRYTKWISSFGYAAWSVVGFLSVLMAWYGVNFILGVGLHSYGFSSGGLNTVIGFTILQLCYVGGVAWLVRQSALRKSSLAHP